MMGFDREERRHRDEAQRALSAVKKQAAELEKRLQADDYRDAQMGARAAHQLAVDAVQLAGHASAWAATLTTASFARRAAQMLKLSNSQTAIFMRRRPSFVYHGTWPI